MKKVCFAPTNSHTVMDDHKQSVKRLLEIIEIIKVMVIESASAQLEYEGKLKTILQKIKNSKCTSVVNGLERILLNDQKEFHSVLKTLKDFSIIMKDVLGIINANSLQQN